MFKIFIVLSLLIVNIVSDEPFNPYNYTGNETGISGLFCGRSQLNFCGRFGFCVAIRCARPYETCTPGQFCQTGNGPTRICQPTNLFEGGCNCCEPICCCINGWTGRRCHIPPICPALLENCTIALTQSLQPRCDLFCFLFIGCCLLTVLLCIGFIFVVVCFFFVWRDKKSYEELKEEEEAEATPSEEE